MPSKVTFIVLFKFFTKHMYDFYNLEGKAVNVLLKISAKIVSKRVLRAESSRRPQGQALGSLLPNL